MRVLIVSQWYPPEPVTLPRDLAEELKSLGAEVDVLTGFPNYPSGAIYPGYRLRPWSTAEIGGVRVVRVWLYPDHSRSAIRRVLNYLSFAFSATVVGMLRLSRYDAVYVYGTPYTAAFPAIALATLWGSRVVFGVQDLWPETLSATGMVRNRALLTIVRWYARFIYAVAARVTVISPGLRQAVIDAGAAPDKVEVVPNWVDTDHYKPMSVDAQLKSTLGLDGTFNVMYAGQIGLPQGLETILAAADLLKERSDIRFVIVGSGVERTRIEAIAAARGLKNVRFLDPYAPTEIPRVLALADVLLVHLRNDPLFRITIPHKIYAYMATGKPLIGALSGDAADVVRRACAGIVCSPEDPAALAQAVSQIAAMPERDRLQLGLSGREAVLASHTKREVIRTIFKILESAAAEGPPRNSSAALPNG